MRIRLALVFLLTGSNNAPLNVKFHFKKFTHKIGSQANSIEFPTVRELICQLEALDLFFLDEYRGEGNS